MDQHWLPFECLHQIRLDRLLHDDGHRATDLQMVGGNRSAIVGGGHDDATKPAAEVVEIVGQREHGHHF
jgi:hypothetical protein